jgi:thiamine-monophosphate kinase
MNEDMVLRKIEGATRQSRGGGVHLGIGDDTAIWRPAKGYETILTCDWSLEGSHFLLDKHPADAIGWKALARATSDIAAMGGIARCFLLSLALPAELTGKWLTKFLAGTNRAAKKFGCVLTGGDTTRRKDVLINVTVVGEVRPGRAVLRSGAQAGDALFVSGTLGQADVGLRELLAGNGLARAVNRNLRKHMYPEPRLDLGRWLAERQLATAMMDLSDGLSTDLPRLCAASGVGARIETSKLPRVVLRDREDALQLALHGGDDYELMFSVAAQNVGRLPTEYRGVALTRIGEVLAARRKIRLAGENGTETELVAGGWDPFRE